MNDQLWYITISVTTFVSTYMMVYYGYPWFRMMLLRQEEWYQRVLVQQLLIDVNARTAVYVSLAFVVLCGLFGYAIGANILFFLIGAGLAMLAPNIVIRYLEQKRRQKLEEQLVDGVTTLASGVRAGLNLVQAFELLVRNSAGPIQQEFSQLLREYQMGVDLNQAMHNTANRIESSNYRLLFTAIEMHRLRGGDTGESLDRICDSIREIQRLEGKLDALTAQGRTQAWMMAVMPLLFLYMLYKIDPQGVGLLFSEPSGRILVMVSVVLIVGAFLWIRKIMTVDI